LENRETGVEQACLRKGITGNDDEMLFGADKARVDWRGDLAVCDMVGNDHLISPKVFSDMYERNKS